MSYIKVVLKSGKDQSLLRFHPWVFSGAIKKMYGEPNEGEIVEVFDNKDQFLGLGHYQIGSIAIRIVSWKQVEVTDEFWEEKIRKAYKLRKDQGLIDDPNTDAYRLVHAEGDSMPGLIIDM